MLVAVAHEEPLRLRRYSVERSGSPNGSILSPRTISKGDFGEFGQCPRDGGNREGQTSDRSLLRIRVELPGDSCDPRRETLKERPDSRL